MRSRSARVWLEGELRTGLRVGAGRSEFDERLDSRARVDCGAFGGCEAPIFTQRFVPRPKNPTCQNLKRFGPLTERLHCEPVCISDFIFCVNGEMYIKLFAHSRRKYEIRNLQSPCHRLVHFLTRSSASRSGASLRATRASTGDGMSLETFEAHDPSPEEVQAARAKADAKRGAPQIPRSLQGMLVLARAFSPPTTDPPVSTQPTPSPRVSTPRGLPHRAHRDRGTPETRWMRANACFATTPGPSSAKGAGTRSSPIPRASTTAHRRNT